MYCNKLKVDHIEMKQEYKIRIAIIIERFLFCQAYSENMWML